jgi:hypothetical protein
MTENDLLPRFDLYLNRGELYNPFEQTLLEYER